MIASPAFLRNTSILVPPPHRHPRPVAASPGWHIPCFRFFPAPGKEAQRSRRDDDSAARCHPKEGAPPPHALLDIQHTHLFVRAGPTIRRFARTPTRPPDAHSSWHTSRRHGAKMLLLLGRGRTKARTPSSSRWAPPLLPTFVPCGITAPTPRGGAARSQRRYGWVEPV